MGSLREAQEHNREFMEGLRQLTEGNRKPPRKARPYVRPQSIVRLEDEYYAFKKTQHPDNPAVCRTSFRDDTANGLTKCILAHLRLKGFFAARVNTTGVYNYKLGKYIRSGSTLGMADVNAIINGRSVQFEVKAGKDRPRPEQLEVQRKVRAAGGEYFFTHSFDEFLNQINAL